MTGDGHMRISDADRNAVRVILERAVGEGMLTLDEFTERVDAVLAARTRGELDPVLRDLPVQRLSGQVPAARIGGPAPATEPVELKGRMTSLTRRGQWTAPPRIQLNTRACDTTLDFTSATLHSAVVELVIDDYCSSTQIILPDHATADLNRVETVAGSATLKVAAVPPSPTLHLIVRGRVRMGSVTVRHPFGATLRRLRSR
ncbi:DUF1707 domain-containing protein [Mycolicibacterium sp. S2-37]|uniref:DUF1707 SHOCT-like domain-containing protein n=1 Tax=Mycolicibacterium sp. S2-37 TaxID=2810297 RepID=UPI001A9426EF|nr:DUF1707 domain-containing protein [Mycolicibacterium sp. S2-37]MBO0680123.1 DUF1707 domain-containing protein [Mycolicibacterium sp. S2-37]